MPNYNVMGVAKAALEASVQYLATDLGSRGVRVNAIPQDRCAPGWIRHRWRPLRLQVAGQNALRRHVDLGDIGGAGVYLLSDLSAAVTGGTLAMTGYHVVGMA